MPDYSGSTPGVVRHEVELEVEVEVNKNICGERDELFDEFWKVYPDRRGKKLLKKEAREFFLKKAKDEDIPQILKAARNYANSKGCRDGFARDAIRFFKEDYWRQWIEPEKPENGGTSGESGSAGKYDRLGTRLESAAD